MSNYNSIQFKQTDITLTCLNYSNPRCPYATWVTSTQIENFDLVFFFNGPGIEKTLPSAYKRLATSIPTGVQSSIFYLYHQVNESAFAEHTYDHNAGSWIVSKNISITTG